MKKTEVKKGVKNPFGEITSHYGIVMEISEKTRVEKGSRSNREHTVIDFKMKFELCDGRYSDRTLYKTVWYVCEPLCIDYRRNYKDFRKRLRDICDSDSPIDLGFVVLLDRDERCVGFGRDGVFIFDGKHATDTF
jgi:hypothetical protein